MIRFKANLSPTSLNELAMQLTKYTQDLEAAKAEIVETLTNYVYQQIMLYVPVKTGALKSSFIKEISSDIGRVYTDLYYAKFVEFGTGIKGSASSYDINKIQISDAWRGYDEEFSGQTAKKFIYKAVLDLETNYVELARNALKQKGLI